MGIPIEKSFVVKAPAAAVWEFLTDPYRVAGCLPGAAITGKEDDQAWGGTITVKVGPVVAAYRGKLRFERLDAAAREAEIAASGQETRGKGGADMRMKSRVVERSPGETEVTVSSDVNVVGVLAQFGRGMIQDVSDQMFRKFTEAMRRELEAPAASAGTSGAAGSEEARGAPAAAGSPPPVPPATAAATATAEATATTSTTTVAGTGGGGETAAASGGPRDAGAAAAPALPAPEARAPAPPPPPPAAGDVLDVGALGAAAAGRAAVRTLRRPGFWIAAAAAALLVYWLLHLNR
jgi:carbon monoxide dehydrogenase subunit G